jgi:hypothetical protein
MAQVKTADLAGPALNWAVAKCEGVAVIVSVITGFSTVLQFRSITEGQKWGTSRYGPSSNWAQGGPIIERERIDILHDPNGGGAVRATNYADFREIKCFGDTPLTAAMRCYVASKLGDAVDVPDALLGN